MLAIILSQDPLKRLVMVAERYVDFLERGLGTTEAEKERRDERMLTPAEAAKKLHINVQTVMTWCREGKLQGVKIGGSPTNGRGGKWLIPREEVDRHLQRRHLINGESKRGAK